MSILAKSMPNSVQLRIDWAIFIYPEASGGAKSTATTLSEASGL
jgi:hypothetical protein